MTFSRRPLAPGEIDHERLWVMVGAFSILVVWAAVATGTAPTLICPVKHLTGWPCAGCGSTRALMAIGHGDLGTALRLNALMTGAVLVGAFWALYAVLTVAGNRRRVRLTLARRDRLVAGWFTLAAVASQWVVLVLDGR